MTRLLSEAVERAGQRAVLLSGWAGIGKIDLPARVFVLDSAPHDWLFPRMAVLVHHGGAGTTAAGFRAGLPAVLVPHLGDQPFWGERVEALGVGPKAIPRPDLTADRLAAAIEQAISDPDMKQRSIQLARKIRAENGVETAVGLIEKHLDQFNPAGARRNFQGA